MTIKYPLRAAVVALGIALGASGAFAQQADAAELARVRAATAKLINLLVEQGVLTQEKAAALLKEVAGPAAPAAPVADGKAAASPPPVRVPYVPEFVRKEIKEEVRAELAAQAQREGWAGPGSVPSWVRELKWDGDVRVRFQRDNFDPLNAPEISLNETNRNRALTALNTTEDRNRFRVRARLGVSATLDDNWSAGVRLTTGNTTDPLSSNQTLGVYNNRFVAAFDRAHVRYRHGEQVNAVFGRFGNPWFGTELLWANDLGFDGIALQWTPKLGSAKGFFTLAALPVQEVELASADKWLYGAQVGADFPSASDRLGGKIGLAYYHYTNIVGRPNPFAGSTEFDYTAPQFGQKGNTGTSLYSMFDVSADPSRPLLALASDYHLVNLTGSIDFPRVAGKRLVVTGDYVKNIGFDRAAVSARMGFDVEPETVGYLVRVAFGSPEVAQRGDWQVFAGYKRVERDAVLDAFTDSDFRLGGTNAKGWMAGLSYALGRRTTGTLRYLSADAISGPALSVDVLQLDLSVRF